MLENFFEYVNLFIKGKIILLFEFVFVNWIKEYYKSKSVKFFIIFNGDFIIFFIEYFEYYFNVFCIYRIKKSGLRYFNLKSFFDFK